jgi:hypothetical protein
MFFPVERVFAYLRVSTSDTASSKFVLNNSVQATKIRVAPMARLKSETPAVTYHISGQSVVRIDGKDYYLGRHGSGEALARYAFLIAECQRNGLSLPDSFDIRSLTALVESLTSGKPVDTTSTHQADEPILVKHLTAAYREHAKVAYAKCKSELLRITQICKELDRYGGDTPVDVFCREHSRHFGKPGLSQAVHGNTSMRSPS